MRRHLLATAVILTVATGCDNVAWGGVDFELTAPPSALGGSPDEPAIEEASPEERAVGFPLLAGALDAVSGRATLVMVGEVAGDRILTPDALTPGEAERLTFGLVPGSEWVLFSEGVRVGTMHADAVGEAAEFCGPRPTLSGVVELVPTASGARRYLALPLDAAAGRGYDPYRSLEHVYDQRVATLTIAGAVIPRFEAAYPPGGLVEARQDIQAFRLVESPTPSVAATFMYRDQLAAGAPGPGAYALFVLGAGSGYGEAYSWLRSAGEEGKGAPRYWGHLDWDADGRSEILLDVFGTDRRWFAGLARRGGAWIRAFEDGCGVSSPAGG